MCMEGYVGDGQTCTPKDGVGREYLILLLTLFNKNYVSWCLKTGIFNRGCALHSQSWEAYNNEERTYTIFVFMIVKAFRGLGLRKHSAFMNRRSCRFGLKMAHDIHV